MRALIEGGKTRVALQDRSEKSLAQGDQAKPNKCKDFCRLG